MALRAGLGPRAVDWRPWAKALLCKCVELCNVHLMLKYEASGSSICSAIIF